MLHRTKRAVIAGWFTRSSFASTTTTSRYGYGVTRGKQRRFASLNDFPLLVCEDGLDDDELWMVGAGPE